MYRECEVLFQTLLFLYRIERNRTNLVDQEIFYYYTEIII